MASGLVATFSVIVSMSCAHGVPKPQNNNTTLGRSNASNQLFLNSTQNSEDALQLAASNVDHFTMLNWTQQDEDALQQLLAGDRADLVSNFATTNQGFWWRRRRADSCRRRQSVYGLQPGKMCLNRKIQSIPRRPDGYVDLRKAISTSWRGHWGIEPKPMIVNLMRVEATVCQERGFGFFNCQVLKPSEAVAITEADTGTDSCPRKYYVPGCNYAPWLCCMYTIHVRVGSRIPSEWESLKVAAKRQASEMITYAGVAVAAHIGVLIASGGAVVGGGASIGQIAAGGSAGKAFIAWAGSIVGAKYAALAKSLATKAVESGSEKAIKDAIKTIVTEILGNRATLLDHYVRRWSTILHPYVKIEGGAGGDIHNPRPRDVSIKKSSFREMAGFPITNVIAPDPKNPRYVG